MADSNGAAPERSGKPPAITVRTDSWEEYEWITAAAERRGNSRGEFLLLSALQRKTGGPMPQSLKALRERQSNVVSSADAKAGVTPRPKRPAATPGRRS
jgi:hypothetical protein